MKVHGDVGPGFRGWWRRRRLAREARSAMRALFDEPELLKNTSLKPAHRGRVDLTGIEVEERELVAFTFHILRHPRPYAFSSQHHRVVENYRFDLRTRKLERGKSVNLSRLAGGDGEPAGSGL